MPKNITVKSPSPAVPLSFRWQSYLIVLARSACLALLRLSLLLLPGLERRNPWTFFGEKLLRIWADDCFWYRSKRKRFGGIGI